MKAIHIKDYPRLLDTFFPRRHTASVVRKDDWYKFRGLLKGGYSAKVLYIIPIDINCVYSIKGYAIEHYQIFFSGNNEGVGNYYLAFRALPLKRSACGEYMYSHYTFEVFNYENFINGKDVKPYFGLKSLSRPTYNSMNNIIDRIELEIPDVSEKL